MIELQHPYYPQNIVLDNYKENTYSFLSILVPFFAVVGAASVGYLQATKGLPTVTKLTGMWFWICGLIHTFFEGYFVTKTLVNLYFGGESLASDLSWFGQAWKEYAKSDSRYLTADGTVLGIELVTAYVEGPLSLYIAYCLAKSRNVDILAFLVSLGQLYGCILYYFTSAVTGFKESRPEVAYFFGYFVLMNFPWIAVPSWCCSEVLQGRSFTVSKAVKKDEVFEKEE
ncbi:hypothetical protein MP638_006395 [Amoeboaphelidium occidentale]|nr:hypothetical protein MP638_006395 [Amoeboaphelidium occidentale]